MSPNSSLFVSTHRGYKRAEVRSSSGDLVNQIGKMDKIYWPTFFAATLLFRVRTPDTATPRAWVLTYFDKETGV